MKQFVLFFFMLAVYASPLFPVRVSALPGSEFEAIEQRVVSLVNRQRQTQKLLPLNMKEIVSAQCRRHSRNMATGLVPAGHQGVEERVDAIRPVINVLTYSENVAVSHGYADPALDAVEGWMKSTGHRAAMFGNYTLTGVGVAMSSDSTFYITEIFIKSR